MSNLPVQEILLVGCGNMGFALLSGWLTKSKGLKVHVVEPDNQLRQRAMEAGAVVYESAADLTSHVVPQVVLFAVKPQYICQILPQYHAFFDNGAFVLSIAAGITIRSMEEVLNGRVAVVRCMPNTPASIGAGALVCCTNQIASETHKRTAGQLLAASGEVYFLDDEALMDAVTALSGSGPAYIFYFIEALAAAGAKAGLPESLAAKLALQTAYGASLLAQNSQNSPGELRQQVTSPGGTTAAALDVLMAPNGLAYVVDRAVAAAKARSLELGQR